VIFRLDSGVSEILALTPVLREWKVREGGKVFVETVFPEVLRGNPNVDKACVSITQSDNFFDLNLLPWFDLIRPLSETFAEKILGDVCLQGWRQEMFHTDDEAKKAEEMMPVKGGVLVCAEGFDEEAMNIIRSIPYGDGRVVMETTKERFGSWGVLHAMAERAGMYIGMDGDNSCVALTTDVPAVVCYTSRDPSYFWPFRGAVPFEVVAPSENVCGTAKICLAKNTLREFGKMYRHVCSEKEQYRCRSVLHSDEIAKAVKRILDSA